MKKKDLMILIGVIIVSAIFSFFLSSVIFGGADKETLTSPIVTPISTEFPQPDPRFFNLESINPTRSITIGESQNEQPF